MSHAASGGEADPDDLLETPGEPTALDTRTEHGTAQGGRPLGPRALKTRQKLLETTQELLAERPVRDVSVVEIARRAGTSPATFYQYFADVEEATLELASAAAEQVPAILEPLAADWKGAQGLAPARVLVDAFVRHWDANHAALLFRNVAAEQGDERFRKVRTRALWPVLRALGRKIEESHQQGAAAAGLHPVPAAAALAAILERLAAYHQELEVLGVSREQLVETCARILHQVVTGETSA
ncbi:MAG: TetR family transcriptional regulator [Proteobacteria bacterium]|nr:MAG: TetR family transcriptional regulator [Pseudomonadota bacterium]